MASTSPPAGRLGAGRGAKTGETGLLAPAGSAPPLRRVESLHTRRSDGGPPGGRRGDLHRQRVAALAAVQGWQDDLEAGRRQLTPQLAEAIRVERERADRIDQELEQEGEDPRPTSPRQSGTMEAVAKGGTIAKPEAAYDLEELDLAGGLRPGDAGQAVNRASSSPDERADFPV